MEPVGAEAAGAGPAQEQFSYHVQDGQQDQVYVDPGHAGPLVNGPDAAVVPPEEGPGQLVQSRPLRLLWSTLGHAR